MDGWMYGWTDTQKHREKLKAEQQNIGYFASIRDVFIRKKM